MSVTIHLSAGMSRLAGVPGTLTLEGDTVGQALARLTALYPAMHAQVFAGDGSLRRFIKVFVNGEDVRLLQGLTTPLRDGDEMTLLTATAGG